MYEYLDYTVNAPKMNILNLPDEILANIMKLAGCFLIKNHDIRLVCKRFYAVYCNFTSCCLTLDSYKVNSYNRTKCLNVRHLVFLSQIHDDIFDSIMHSLRRPFRMVIENHEKGLKNVKLKEIVERFAVHVSKLEFRRDHENILIDDFGSIMRSMVNVEEAIFELNIYGNPRKLKRDPITLPYLKKLILIHCDEESMDAIVCLKASLLEEFHVHIHTEDEFDFTKVFKQNNTIKKVVMTGKLQNPLAFKHLQLTHLQIYNDGNVSFLREVISHQPNLKYLNLLFDQDLSYDTWWLEEDEESRIRIGNEVFEAICTLKHLETLKVGIEELLPDTVVGFVNLVNLKELVMTAVGEYTDYESDSEYSDKEAKQVRKNVHFQTNFRKLISTSLPNLESFTWSLANCEVDYHDNEFSGLGDVNIIKTMARNFPNLKYLEIKMENTMDVINVRDALKLFPHLESLKLKICTSFVGEQIQMHENIKHMKIDGFEPKFLIEMLRLMPNLESLAMMTTLSFNKNFLVNLQSAVPISLKNLELKLYSHIEQDFVIENIQILQYIIKNLNKCNINITGNCNLIHCLRK